MGRKFDPAYQRHAGKVFNNVKIIEHGKSTEKCVAECLLCGKIWNPSLTSVTQREIKSCGCIKYKYEDFTGRTFNDCTIVKQYGGQNKKALIRCKCGKEWEALLATIVGGHTKSCGCGKLIQGKDHHLWKGGIVVNHDGYILERVYGNKFHKDKQRVFQHRLVMEKHLGRKLKKNENVHHKNGDRKDNRIENLELWVRTQPKGQRVSDLVKWAEEILKTYKD